MEWSVKIKDDQPAKFPNADSTHATPPLASGYADPSSAVIKASGIDHTKGKMRKPKIENKKPADRTDSSIPKGPPETLKNIIMANGTNEMDGVRVSDTS
jgi:hypothetical protein